MRVITSNPLTVLQTRKGTLPNSLCEAQITPTSKPGKDVKKTTKPHNFIDGCRGRNSQ